MITALAADVHLCDEALVYLQAAPPDDDSAFWGTLRCGLFHAIMSREDDGRLLTYLSTIPLDVDDPDGLFIEYSILDPFGPTPRVDRIMLLFKAYERATNPDARANLVRAVRRAFYHSIRPSWTDSEVMGMLPGDIRGELPRLKPNREYAEAYSPGFFDSGNVVPAPLLIPSNGPDRVKPIVLDLAKRHPPDWK